MSTSTVPAASGTDRNSFSGSSGSFAFASRTMKPASATTAPAKYAIVVVEVQP